MLAERREMKGVDVVFYKICSFSTIIFKDNECCYYFPCERTFGLLFTRVRASVNDADMHRFTCIHMFCCAITE